MGSPSTPGKSAPVAAKAAAIDAAQAHPLTWKTVVKRALAVAVAGASPLPGAAQAHRGAGGLAAAVDAEPGLVHGLPGCRAGVFHLQLRPAAAGTAH